MNKFKTEYKREHYYFHRTDPTPHIPIEGARPRSPESKWVFKTVVIIGYAVLIWFILVGGAA